MDRNESVKVAKQIAADLVEAQGSNVQQADFMNQAEEAGCFAQLGASDLTDIFRDALGLDRRTGVPITE